MNNIHCNFDYISKIRDFFNYINYNNISAIDKVVFKYLKSNSKESISYTIESIQWLLNLNIPQEDKLDFIKKEINIDFTKYNINPLELLNQLHEKLKSLYKLNFQPI